MLNTISSVRYDWPLHSHISSRSRGFPDCPFRGIRLGDLPVRGRIPSYRNLYGGNDATVCAQKRDFWPDVQRHETRSARKGGAFAAPLAPNKPNSLPLAISMVTSQLPGQTRNWRSVRTVLSTGLSGCRYVRIVSSQIGANELLGSPRTLWGCPRQFQPVIQHHDVTSNGHDRAHGTCSTMRWSSRASKVFRSAQTGLIDLCRI